MSDTKYVQSGERAAKRARDLLLTLDAIHAELDGTEWTPETLEAIASHLRAAGYVVRDVTGQ